MNDYYAGLEKINRVPNLRTIIGIGFMLYGSTNPDPVNGSDLATYYFTVFFIPIFPICRYRVIRNGKSYSFLGKAPLRDIDKWHLGITFAIIGMIAMNAMLGINRSSYSHEAPVEQPVPVAPARAPAPAPAPAESPVKAEPAAAYTANLPGQQNSYSPPPDTGLKDQIKLDRLELRSMESSLKSIKADIESNKSLLESYRASGNHEAYNMVVVEYNAKITELNSRNQKYRERQDEVNAKISRYNAGER